jgi:glycosyltransferase involved in cell wall biosynthesis
LPGFVERERLPDELSRARVFAAPSRYEGGPGFVYLEAMACGLPVIACAGSGAAEVVIPGENGALVPPGDVPAVADALRKLLGGERDAMARRARAYAVEHADGERCLDRIEAFYRSVVDRSKGAPG